jgi:hypothetical protein
VVAVRRKKLLGASHGGSAVVHDEGESQVRVGLVAELPSNLARGLSGRRDFGPRMGGTLSTHSTQSTLTTRASISTLHSSNMTSYAVPRDKN